MRVGVEEEPLAKSRLNDLSLLTQSGPLNKSAIFVPVHACLPATWAFEFLPWAAGSILQRNLPERTHLWTFPRDQSRSLWKQNIIDVTIRHMKLPMLMWLVHVCVCVASGGRDRRGGPVLTFPSRSNHDRIRTDDLRRLIAYLAGIPRLHFHHVCSVLCARVWSICALPFPSKRGGNRLLKTNTRWLVEETREGVEMRTWCEIIQQPLARCSNSAA